MIAIACDFRHTFKWVADLSHLSSWHRLAASLGSNAGLDKKNPLSIFIPSPYADKPVLIMHTGFVHAISLECSRLRKSAFYFSPLCSTEALGIVNRPLDSLLRACAARGYSSWFVCLSVSLSVCVCRRLFWHNRLPEINGFRTTNAWKLNKWFSWNELHSRDMPWMQAKKSICIIALLYFDLIRSLCSLEAQELTTKGVYRLPHTIHYCS